MNLQFTWHMIQKCSRIESQLSENTFLHMVRKWTRIDQKKSQRKRKCERNKLYQRPTYMVQKWSKARRDWAENILYFVRKTKYCEIPSFWLSISEQNFGKNCSKSKKRGTKWLCLFNYLFFGNFLDRNAFHLVNAYGCEYMGWRQGCAAGNRCTGWARTKLL